MGILFQCHPSLPDTLATSKILSTEYQGLFSGLEANWHGAAYIRMFNKLSYPFTPPKKAPPNSLLGGACGHCLPQGRAWEGLPVSRGQSHARNSTNNVTRWMILCPHSPPRWVLFDSLVRTQACCTFQLWAAARRSVAPRRASLEEPCGVAATAEKSRESTGALEEVHEERADGLATKAGHVAGFPSRN